MPSRRCSSRLALRGDVGGLGAPEGHAHLERIARLHNRDRLDIRPEFYDLWFDCLIVTVKEFDSLFGPAVERAWRDVLTPGIEFMKSRY